MSFERCWLEREGAPDAAGRALLALAHVSRFSPLPLMRKWAWPILETALPLTLHSTSPRLWAFALMAMSNMLILDKEWHVGQEYRQALADLLSQRWNDAATDDWPWFEDTLAYDNGRLPEAIITTGLDMADTRLIDIGFTALEALWKWQHRDGVLQPVGSESFGMIRTIPARFDQQPLEAAAMVSACLAAFRASRKSCWQERAQLSYAWFAGRNVHGAVLGDTKRGHCYDGLNPSGVNQNSGAESVLAFLQSSLDISTLKDLSE